MLRFFRILVTLFADHGLLVLGGLATLVLAELLYISAWLSTNPRAWQYDLWAALVILLWAQPWSSRDRYRTDSRILRKIFYGILVIAAAASAFVFNRWQPGLIGIWIVALFLIEHFGLRSLRKV